MSIYVCNVSMNVVQKRKRCTVANESSVYAR